MEGVTDDRLVETLRSLGIHGRETEGIQTLDQAEPTLQDNLRLYDEVNRALLSVVEQRDPGECCYITGEMQVLRGRAFRVACRRMRERYRTPFCIIGYVRELPGLATDLSARVESVRLDLLRWWCNQWSDLPAIDYIDTLYVVGARHTVDLLVSVADVSPHFMLCGDYAFLQEPHEHGQPKRMWLLRIPAWVARVLRHRIAVIRGRAELASPAFGRTLTRVNSFGSLSLLFRLLDEGTVAITEVRNMTEDPRLGAAGAAVADLEALGFIYASEGCYRITDVGVRYTDFVFPVPKRGAGYDSRTR